MDKLEEALSEVLKKEAEKFSKPIICNINGKQCSKCQPLCYNRSKQELRPITWENGEID